jgi:hypothetical protein
MNLFSFPAYSLLHLGISAERLFATLTVRRYEHSKTKLSSIILTCIGLASAAFTFYMLRNVNWTMQHDYCSLSSIPTLGPLSRVITILAFFNIPIVCIDLALYTTNARQLDK